ncbi:MAG: SpoIIE family protein phosphatase [Leptolyngbyaceae cyanobacterium bins.59]|nr:SpoIIE family protein phosphatase [Leptolyngbyaceae cyanobacterium bins.59]
MFQILLIDDNSVNRLLLSKTLQKQGYEVYSACDGEEGLAQAQHIRPAMIICDWMMPKMDGLEVCRRVKADPDLSTTFFILLTSRGGVEDRVQGLDTGADDFLAKPVEMNELKARVRAGLRIHQLTRDLQAKNQALAELTSTLKDQRQALEDELVEAADYVRSLLPPPVKGAVSITPCFMPSRQLGGDCFDYFWLDPDFLAIYLLDVSGHGLGAALLSVSMLNLMRSQALDNVNFYQPAQVLQALNDSFQMDDRNDKYFTLWYGVYNRISRQLTYASAGHPPAILLSQDSNKSLKATRLKGKGLPIGMIPDVQYGNERCEISESSTLYVISDGVYEVAQKDGQLLGLDRFIELLLCHCEMHLENSAQTLPHILEHIQANSLRGTFDDDFSILQIGFR